MGFFGTLGKIGKGALGVVKGVGIAAGNVVGNYVGVGAIGSNINSALSKNNATGGAPTASVDGAAVPMVSQPTVTAPNSGGILGAVTGALNSFSSWVNGDSRPQVDVNTGIGGRLADTSKSGMPSWLLPAGLAAGGLLLFTSMSGKRR